MSPTPACAERRTVDAHFAGGLRPAREHALRAHLPGCEACRARYAQHLLLAEVDASVPGARLRLARGLGLARPAPARRWPALGGGVLVAACAALLLWVRMPAEDAGFTARGEPGAAAAPAALEVYRVGADGRPHPVPRTVHARDELAFAYRNPAALPYLLVFARDAAQRVYWYHPSWTSTAEEPVAVRIAQDGALHELPEAIRHPLSAGRLELYALFSQAPLSVRTVEARLARGTPLAAGPGEQLHRVELEVTP